MRKALQVQVYLIGQNYCVIREHTLLWFALCGEKTPVRTGCRTSWTVSPSASSCSALYASLLLGSYLTGPLFKLDVQLLAFFVHQLHKTYYIHIHISFSISPFFFLFSRYVNYLLDMYIFIYESSLNSGHSTTYNYIRLNSHNNIQN